MELKKKYGLKTAIAMVVGIIIGSGVFFKTGAVLEATSGDLSKGILAWIIGGVIMILSVSAFSILTQMGHKSGGVVEYMEYSCGKKPAYYLGFYISTIYFPCITAILAWLCGKYTAIFLGVTQDMADYGDLTIILSFAYMILMYFINTLAPIIAGKIQVSTTIIKLIPLVFMGVVGLIYGLFFNDNMLLDNFTSGAVISSGKGMFNAICSTVFAYEGWIIATSIESEVVNPKKNMGKALVIGGLIVLVVYLLYYIGLAGTYPNADFIFDTDVSVKKAFALLLGQGGGAILYIFIIISCLGTLNGLTMGCSRGMYALAKRKKGPMPEVFSQIDAKTNVANNSSALGLLMTCFWLVIWYGNFKGWYGIFGFIDISELSIILLYSSYIPIYIMMIVKNKEAKVFSRFIIPILAIAAAVFMIIACIFAHKLDMLLFVGVIAFTMLMAFLIETYNRRKENHKQTI